MENILFKKTLFLSIVIIFFIGCTTPSNTLDMPKCYQISHKENKTYNQMHQNSTGFYTPSVLITNKNKATATIKSSSNNSLNLSGSGYIKGIIQKIQYSKADQSWIYYIKGIDFANNKLKYAKVYSSKRVAHLHDLIYAVINNGFITSLYIYKTTKSYKVNKKRKIVNKSKQIRKKVNKAKKNPKTRGRKQVISAPQVEKVIF